VQVVISRRGRRKVVATMDARYPLGLFRNRLDGFRGLFRSPFGSRFGRFVL